MATEIGTYSPSTAFECDSEFKCMRSFFFFVTHFCAQFCLSGRPLVGWAPTQFKHVYNVSEPLILLPSPFSCVAFIDILV